MQLGLFIIVCIAIPFRSFCADRELASDITRLANWITSLQYTQSDLASCGAIRLSSGIAANDAHGTGYCQVSPYFANLAVLGLLRANVPQSARTAELWITWYFAHLRPGSSPAGVPDDHFYQSNGTGETTCLDPRSPQLCHHNDATDSAAATFLSVLAAAHKAGISPQALNTAERKRAIETLAGVILRLQQSDGLCWAKTDYHVKYLEDNCEVFAGLNDLANLEREAFHDNAQSSFYGQVAEHVRQGILDELYNPQTKLCFVAKFEDGKRSSANLNKWYPDTQAQLWPSLFGVLSPRESRMQEIISAISEQWDGHQKPDWASHPEQVNKGWAEAGLAYAMFLGGERLRAQTYFRAIKKVKFRQPGTFEGPFNVADAGWLLQLLTQLDGER